MPSIDQHEGSTDSSDTPVRFEITARCRTTRARVGRVHTAHGSFDTPAFMPVGTRATVKGVMPGMIGPAGINAQIVLANTYHLMLRPGSELIHRRGGLHGFMNWQGPILTDSGGYQAYSMSDINAVTDDAVTFKSIIDGSSVVLTPERAIRVQNELGADIIMALDDCPPSVDPTKGAVNQTRIRLAAQRDTGRGGTYNHPKRIADANERTIRWLERCKAEHNKGHASAHRQGLFGIVQGGTDLDARSWCVERVCNIDLPGYAIGGVAVGESTDDIGRVVRHTARLMPEDKPKYLMGVGYERDLVEAVRAGVDMFDCVLPTRNGRNANAFTRTGQIRLKNAKFAEDDRPLEEGCDCPACNPAAYPWAAVLGSPKFNTNTGSENNLPTNNSGSGSVQKHASFEPPIGDSAASGAVQGDRAFSRAYIRHLFIAGEMLGPILVSLHNLRHFQRLMLDIRRAVSQDDWAWFESRWPVAYAPVQQPEQCSN